MFSFITTKFLGYVSGGLVVALLVASGLLYLQSERLDIEKKEHALFVKGVADAGKQAEKEKAATIAADLKRKKEADNAYKKSLDDLRVARADAKRLRDERARGGYLPPAPAGARDPTRATIDRADFKRAMEYLDEHGQGIADEGDAARAGLNAAKAWAQRDATK